MPSSDNVMRIAAKMLLQGETSEQAEEIRKSTEANIGEPLKKIVIHHLKDTDLNCSEKTEIANNIVNSFYEKIRP